MLASLQTESRNGASFNIDVASTTEMCYIINDADSIVAPAVRECIGEIVPIVDEIARRVRRNGRVVYIGAGTSGRLGVLDASEIPPTFSAPYDQFIGMMAGGDTAIRNAAEGAEDSLTQAGVDLEAICPPLTPLDTLIGIAASGRTPYVISGLAHARGVLGMFTVGVTCVKPSLMREHSERVVECVVGPEVVTGSTRMKAGTATKLILNMISTGVMIRIGKTYGNMMVDLKTSNLKLVDRSRRIFRTLHPSTKLSDSEIDQLISSCSGSVKLALVVAKAGSSVEEGIAKLNAANGVLKKAWESETASQADGTRFPISDGASQKPELVLCVDGGGTKCSVAIADNNGLVAMAVGGSCDFVTENHEHSLSLLKDIINNALDMVPETHPIRRHGVLMLPSNQSLFVSAWIGAAGLDRETELKAIRPKISQLLNIPDPSKLHVTNDGALLSAGIVSDPESSICIDTGIVLITGTGSLACGYRLLPDRDSPIPVLVDRSGGWGYLLGDEGSAYHIGKTALQRALRARDLGLPPTLLHQAIVDHFGSVSVKELLASIYRRPQTMPPSMSSTTEMSSKSRIASLCPIVLNLAFSRDGSARQDMESLAIAQESAASAAELVLPLVRADGPIRASTSILILGGALAQVKGYRGLIVDALSKRGQIFARVEVVKDAASHAVRHLTRCYLD